MQYHAIKDTQGSKTTIKALFDIYLDLPAYFLALIRLVANANKIKFLLKKETKDRRCVLLGNGPSLNNDVNSIREKIAQCDFFCVNHFADSSLFSDIRPRYYTFVDPYFWKNDAHDDFKRKRSVTFKNIADQTTWKMTIFLPIGIGREIENFVSLNKNINIRYYLNIQLRGAHSIFTSRLLTTGLFTPFSINVLSQALYIASRIGYKEIIIFGADTSWYKDLEVNQYTNEVSMRFKHFHNEEHRKVYTDCTRTIASDMQFELWKVYETFTCYKILARYCDLINIKIVNHSSNSEIDTFQRVGRFCEN